MVNVGGKRQLAQSKNCRDARAFGVRLRSETDSPLSPTTAPSKTKRIHILTIYWTSLASRLPFGSHPGVIIDGSTEAFLISGLVSGDPIGNFCGVTEFLEVSKYIDWDAEAIVSLAGRLAEGLEGEEAVLRRCFDFVRDEILHSLDHERNPVTCRASDVLLHGTGYCYAKSHLLAALLRANGIPTGLCYQRLLVDPGGPLFCLHGLNAVYLQSSGWYRVDPRGNKPGIESGCTPPIEQLPFSAQSEGGVDVPGIFEAPLPEVVAVLESWETFDQVAEHLPDLRVA
jgi:transglutaminase-like putative cysteine protease